MDNQDNKQIKLFEVYSELTTIKNQLQALMHSNGSTNAGAIVQGNITQDGHQTMNQNEIVV
jgi:hypothetical protein